MIDLDIFNAINGLAGKFSALDTIAIFFAVYAVYVIAFLILLRRNKNGIAIAAMAFVSVYVVEFFIQLFIQRPRPFAEYDVMLLIDHPSDPGFPSSHASSSFALAQSLYFVDKGWGTVAFVMAGLVALARVFVGVHYLTDVLAGTVIGLACSFGIKYLWDRLNL